MVDNARKQRTRFSNEIEENREDGKQRHSDTNCTTSISSASEQRQKEENEEGSDGDGGLGRTRRTKI